MSLADIVLPSELVQRVPSRGRADLSRTNLLGEGRAEDMAARVGAAAAVPGNLARKAKKKTTGLAAAAKGGYEGYTDKPKPAAQDPSKKKELSFFQKHIYGPSEEKPEKDKGKATLGDKAQDAWRGALGVGASPKTLEREKKAKEAEAGGEKPEAADKGKPEGADEEKPGADEKPEEKKEPVKNASPDDTGSHHEVDIEGHGKKRITKTLHGPPSGKLKPHGGPGHDNVFVDESGRMFAPADHPIHSVGSHALGSMQQVGTGGMPMSGMAMGGGMPAWMTQGGGVGGLGGFMQQHGGAGGGPQEEPAQAQGQAQADQQQPGLFKRMAQGWYRAKDAAERAAQTQPATTPAAQASGAPGMQAPAPQPAAQPPAQPPAAVKQSGAETQSPSLDAAGKATDTGSVPSNAQAQNVPQPDEAPADQPAPEAQKEKLTKQDDSEAEKPSAKQPDKGDAEETPTGDSDLERERVAAPPSRDVDTDRARGYRVITPDEHQAEIEGRGKPLAKDSKPGDDDQPPAESPAAEEPSRAERERDLVSRLGIPGEKDRDEAPSEEEPKAEEPKTMHDKVSAKGDGPLPLAQPAMSALNKKEAQQKLRSIQQQYGHTSPEFEKAQSDYTKAHGQTGATTGFREPETPAEPATTTPKATKPGDDDARLKAAASVAKKAAATGGSESGPGSHEHLHDIWDRPKFFNTHAKGHINKADPEIEKAYKRSGLSQKTIDRHYSEAKRLAREAVRAHPDYDDMKPHERVQAVIDMATASLADGLKDRKDDAGNPIYGVASEGPASEAGAKVGRAARSLASKVAKAGAPTGPLADIRRGGQDLIAQGTKQSTQGGYMAQPIARSGKETDVEATPSDDPDLDEKRRQSMRNRDAEKVAAGAELQAASYNPSLARTPLLQEWI